MRGVRTPRIRLSLSPEEVDTLWICCIQGRHLFEGILRNPHQSDQELSNAARELIKIEALVAKVRKLPGMTEEVEPADSPPNDE